jgi:hypothetical protein
MPKNTRKNRRTTTPNVFVQSNRPDDDNNSDASAPESDASASDSAPKARARVQRTTQRASVRSEIYTRSLSAELKKMGALSSVVVIVLVVLTFAL